MSTMAIEAREHSWVPVITSEGLALQCVACTGVFDVEYEGLCRTVVFLPGQRSAVEAEIGNFLDRKRALVAH